MELGRESLRDLVRRSRQCSALPLFPPQPSRLEALPDNCIGHILSWHRPNDLAAVSTSSRALFGAARQDILWKAIWLALPSPLRVAGVAAGRPIYEACARAHESAIDATRRWAAETFAAHWQRFGLVGACSRVVRSLGLQLNLRLSEMNAKYMDMRGALITSGGEALKSGVSPVWETFTLGSSLHYAPSGKSQTTPSEVKSIEIMASISMAAPPLNSNGGASEERLEVALMYFSNLKRHKWSEKLMSLSKDGSTALYCFRKPSFSRSTFDFCGALLIAVSIDRSRQSCFPTVGPPSGCVLFVHVLMPHARLAPAFASQPLRHRSAALDAAFAPAAGTPNSTSEPTDSGAQCQARATLSVAVCFRSLAAVLWECAFTRRRFEWGDQASEWRSSAPLGSFTPRRSNSSSGGGAPLPLPPNASPLHTVSCLLLTDELPDSMTDEARQVAGPMGLAAGGRSFDGLVLLDLVVWEDASKRVLWATSTPVAVRAASGFFGRSGRRAVVLEEAQGWLWAELAPDSHTPDAALRVQALYLGLHWSPDVTPPQNI